MSANALKAKIKGKVKGQVKLDIDKYELIKILSETTKIAPEQGVFLTKKFVVTPNKKLMLLKELDFMGDNQLIFHEPRTVNKIISLLKLVPSDEELEFIIKDNYFVIKSKSTNKKKRSMRFKMSSELLLSPLYQELVEKNVYDMYTKKIKELSYIELSANKLLEINKVYSVLGATKVRFTLSDDKSEITIKFVNNDSSIEEASSLQYEDSGFEVVPAPKDTELQNTESISFTADWFSKLSIQNYKFYFTDICYLKGEDGSIYVLAPDMEN